VVCEGGGCWRGKAVQRLLLLLLCHSSSLRFALWSTPASIVSYRCCKRLEQQDAQKVFNCCCVGWRNCPPAQHILPSLRALLCTNFCDLVQGETEECFCFHLLTVQQSSRLGGVLSACSGSWRHLCAGVLLLVYIHQCVLHGGTRCLLLHRA
jgi:hypothetical protein